MIRPQFEIDARVRVWRGLGCSAGAGVPARVGRRQSALAGCDDVRVAHRDDPPGERPAVPDLVDPHDLSLLETTLALSVNNRVRRLISYVRFVEVGRAAL